VILELDGIEKSFGPVTVLRGVTLGVAAAEVHAVLGENGAGKSTVMRILLGIETADRGVMKLGGAVYRPRGPGDAQAAGVVMVPQERTLCPHLDVTENIVLGSEPTRRTPGGSLLRAVAPLRRDEARAIASRVLGLVTGDPDRIPLDARAGDLRVADQQLVEIARALAQGGTSARVLVLDEPTSSLGHADAVRLFERVDALREGGLAIILVTHFLADVRDHADRYTVLRDGQVRGAGDPKQVPSEQIVAEMLGRDLERTLSTPRSAAPDSFGSSDPPLKSVAAATPVEPLLEVTDLAGRDKPRAATFRLARGEILGIAGLVGSGRTELLRAVIGLDERTSGSVRTAAPRGVGLLSEDRGGEGLMLARSIADNVTLSPRGPALVSPAATRAEGARWIAELAIRAAGPEQAVSDLSGGNQQKVQLARLLREDYDVLLVDEPTRGIDVGSKAQVLALLRELAGKGKGIVLVSSQLDELLSTCDRIAVLRRGELGDARPATSWDEGSLLLEAAS